MNEKHILFYKKLEDKPQKRFQKQQRWSRHACCEVKDAVDADMRTEVDTFLTGDRHIRL